MLTQGSFEDADDDDDDETKRDHGQEEQDDEGSNNPGADKRREMRIRRDGNQVRVHGVFSMFALCILDWTFSVSSYFSTRASRSMSLKVVVVLVVVLGTH